MPLRITGIRDRSAMNHHVGPMLTELTTDRLQIGDIHLLMPNRDHLIMASVILGDTDTQEPPGTGYQHFSHHLTY